MSATVTKTLVRFTHGLGDCVHFALMAEMYRGLSLDFSIACEANKKELFELCGLETVDANRARAPHTLWHDPPTIQAPTPENWWRFNKAFRNVSVSPLPNIGPAQEHVQRYLDTKLDPLSRIPQATWKEIDRYFADMPRPIILLHTHGNTSQNEKSIPKEQCLELYRTLVEATGGTVVLLDWDNRVPRGQKPHVRHPADEGFWPVMSRLLVMQARADLFIGVDSGPLHLCRLTNAKAIGVWRGYCHPVRYSLPRQGQVNLVLGNHEVNKPVAKLFNIVQNDDPVFVDPQVLANLAVRAIRDDPANQPWPGGIVLAGETFDDRDRVTSLTSKSYDQKYYDEHRVAGLDYLGYGDWQLSYGRWFVESLNLKGKKLLDVGCACGSILRGLGAAGAVVRGVDLSEHMVQLGRRKWPDMAPLLNTCDAVNLHLFGDGAFEALHSNQVAEHWRPELVPFILRELRRVTVPGGFFWCGLDTTEKFARQKRGMDGEDPTHVCIQSMTWWHEALKEAGWVVCTSEVQEALMSHKESFLKTDDWDWFAARCLK